MVLTEGRNPAETGKEYAAPALDKGLDILELLCRAEAPLTQKQIAAELGRTVGELYRMVASLVARNYIGQIGETYHITTKLFELAQINPPTHRLLLEATPIMQKLASEIEQSCHLTVYGQGRQVVIAKVDSPSSMGYSIRLGSELDVIVSASGRVMLAFQEEATRRILIEEVLLRRPDHADAALYDKLDAIRERGFESAQSTQIRGMHAVSYPILDSQNHSIAALTVPYADRIDLVGRKSIDDVQKALGLAAKALCVRMGSDSGGAPVQPPVAIPNYAEVKGRRRRKPSS
jgi:DNA-binding IclR family transcriptional regulator